jgi:hypothetical protein
VTGGPMSRVAKAAEEVADLTASKARATLASSTIAVVLAEDSPQNRETFIAATLISLLFAGRVAAVISKSNDELWQECMNLALDRRGTTAAIERREDLALVAFDAALVIGAYRTENPRVISVASNGWLVRLSCAAVGEQAAIHVLETWAHTSSNPITAIGAATLGTGECFLRLVGLSRPAISGEWDFFHYLTGSPGDFQPGPDVPSVLEIRGAQVGVGSVGGAFDYVLSRLLIGGQLAVVDRQSVGPENFGPHPLVGVSSKGPKVDLAVSILRTQSDSLEVIRFAEPFRLFSMRLGNEVRHPDVVISALDRVRPRHQVQRLWAPLHIDAATGGLTCQIIVRTNPGTGRCLIEAFDPVSEPDEEEIWSEMTGLAPERFSDPMALISDADVANAAPEFQPVLAAAQAAAKRVCNVVIGAELGLSAESSDFAAATPFNALLAGALAVGECAKSATSNRDGTFAQFNFLSMRFYSELTRSGPDCECARRIDPRG